MTTAVTESAAVKLLRMPLKVLESGRVGAFVTGGKSPVVAMVWVKMLIHMPVKMLGPVIPGTCPDKDASRKPFRAVKAVGSTIVRSVVVIAVRADRRRADGD